MGKFVVRMLARTPNSDLTPAHLPDIGGDIPAAAAHSSADLIKGIENKWGNKKIVHAYHHMTRTTFFGVKRVLRQKNKRGVVHVDFQRVQTVVTKIESESFCVH